MIDAYTEGVVERMSPEAPVPVVNVKRRYNRLGGAANVALNLKALGAEAIVCSVVGNDSPADTLLHLMQDHELDTKGIVKSPNRITTVKHRVLNGDKQLVRIDEEDTFELNEEEYRHLYQEVIVPLVDSHTFQVIILQDYNKGVLSPRLIHDVIALAHQQGIPVAVDPKKRNFLAYRGVTLFKPNAKELRDGLGINAETIDELRKAADKLLKQLDCQHLMVTLSERGAMILSKSEGQEPEFHHVAACKRTIVDVSGAGDTVLCVAALCVALGKDPLSMVTLSNIAGGLVCEEVGVTPVNKQRFDDEVRHLGLD